MKGSGAPFSVSTLDEVGRLPWRAGNRLRRAQKRGRTGVLLIAEIREPVRGFTDRAGVVSIRENGLEICFRSAVELREGDVLVALCDPVQPNTFYRKSRTADSWFVGILSPGEDVSDSFKTRRPPRPTVAP
ncbi:hypothetical protein OH768_12255 [Streptomyces sp. NBC_01622]|uniref:hypothetical protein n=1 Tax=Streptomyces sp. NBC_01622 TaxID=2975903 RepID=UPI0038643D0A|nr:hypothetical protein OH768_12255 [Streptomyces sp. NBC_01622]